MEIQFCGAATGVTGSCHLLTSGEHKILLDCGMFQGGKAMEQLNREPFPFDPAEIECVVISHAHIDHCGRLPLLVKQGFKGPIYATDATADLLDVMLKDSAHIHEQDAEQINRKRMRANAPQIVPLYTIKDAEAAIRLIVPRHYDQLFEINDRMKVVYNDAGHILGSAIIELWVTEDEKTSKIVFSGDLGMPHRPILKDPTFIKKADYVIMETTYGNRLHEEADASISSLINIAVETTKRGGNVVIPSFAVGRTQELIYELNKVYDGTGPAHDALKDVPVYVDSPMALAATEVFKKNAHIYDEEATEYILRGDHPMEFEGLRFTETSEESKALNGDGVPKIILSASGMCDAGRIRHHLKHNLWDEKNSIVFVGYQAEGTLGRTLIEGAKTVTLFGEEISVNAQIYNLEGFSGHADRDVLYKWITGFKDKKPSTIFLVHGEHDAKVDFAAYLKEHAGWDATVVSGFDVFELNEGSTQLQDKAEHEFVSDEEIAKVRMRISEMHRQLENILYGTDLAMQTELDPGKLSDIKNAVADLESGVLKLAASVGK